MAYEDYTQFAAEPFSAPVPLWSDEDEQYRLKLSAPPVIPQAQAAPAPSAPPSPNASYKNQVSQLESGGGKALQSNTSSALGNYHILRGTFNDLQKAYPDLQGRSFEELKTDRDLNDRAMDHYTNISEGILQKAGLPVDNLNRYALHSFGHSGGLKVLDSPDETPLASVLSSQAIKANPTYAQMTVGDWKAGVAPRLGQNVPQVSKAGANPTIDKQAGQVIDQHLLESNDPEKINQVLYSLTSSPGQRAAAISRLGQREEIDNIFNSISKKIGNIDTPEGRKKLPEVAASLPAGADRPSALMAWLVGDRNAFRDAMGWSGFTTVGTDENGKKYIYNRDSRGNLISAIDYDTGAPATNVPLEAYNSQAALLGNKGKDFTKFGKDLVIQTKDGSFHNAQVVQDTLNDTISYLVTSGPMAGKYINNKDVTRQTKAGGDKPIVYSYRDKDGNEVSLPGAYKTGSIVLVDNGQGQPVEANKYIESLGGKGGRERSITWKPATEIGAGDIPNAISYSKSLQAPSFAFDNDSTRKAYQFAIRAYRAEAEMTDLENKIGTNKLAEVQNAMINAVTTSGSLTASTMQALIKEQSPGDVKDYLSAVNRFIFGVLRPESGAAINRDEIVRYIGVFGVSPGDKWIDLDTRRTARRSELVQLAGSAGVAAPYLLGVLDGTYPIPKADVASISTNKSVSATPEGKHTFGPRKEVEKK